jgi:crossover junction endodeoxyribonuclease RusA
MKAILNVFIPGLPAPQGSKKLMGKFMVESSKKVQPWRQDVKHIVAASYHGRVLDEAVSIEIEFLFHRPKSHFNAKGNLKPSAPAHLVSRANGDLDKLLRSTFDAISVSSGGQLIADDCLIMRVTASKRYCLEQEYCGAHMLVYRYRH